MTISLAQEELNGIHAPLTLEFGAPRHHRLASQITVAPDSPLIQLDLPYPEQSMREETFK
jgi:hypothetical protein